VNSKYLEYLAFVVIKVFLDQGILRVDLIDGHDIRGVDRSGKSDPFAVFCLNEQKVFKSNTKKKTITPEWNEHFEVTIVCVCVMFKNTFS